MKKLISFPLLILFLFLRVAATGQLSVTPGSLLGLTPTQLVQIWLVGQGTTVSNATLNGSSAIISSNMIGTFKATGVAQTQLGIDSGILITNGNASIAIGPNLNCGAGQDMGMAGDPDLTIIADTITYDRCVLQFDFIPFSDTIQVSYVFGSEELYNFCYLYNDAFGFFLSGPGITGPFSNNSVDIALMPNSSNYVTINNICSDPSSAWCNSTILCGNDTMCVNRPPGCGAYLQYNALTHVFRAWHAVQPCQVYHIKIAIADAVDHVLDSGVFLDQKSFSSGSVTGPTPVCADTSRKVYSTQAGMLNYIWHVSPGGTIISGGTLIDHTITIHWNTAGVDTISVSYTIPGGCSIPSPLLLVVTVLPLPIPSISGLSTVCAGDTGIVYTTQPGMTNYQWTISAGGTVTNGGTSSSNTVTVIWNTAGLQTVSVNYTNTNGCTATNPAVITVNVQALPVPAIMGPDSACILSTGNNYSTETGMLYYIWTVSSGGIITSGWGTNSITVTWNSAGQQQVTVIYTNQSGCTAANPTSFNVTVKPLPGIPGNITGPSPVCAGTAGLVYRVSPVSSAISYVWTLPTGFLIVSGNGTNSITVTAGTNAASGNILVYATNLCGAGQSSPPFPVTINYPTTGNAGPDGLTCQTTPFTITQASASNDSAVDWHSNGQGTLTGTTTLSPTYTAAQGETGPVTLTLIIYGKTPCGIDTSKMILDIEPKATVNAGNDLITCGQTPVVLSGSSASDYQSLLWTTSGSGVFNDPTILHPTYTPGVSDFNAGSVFLTLHATSVVPCEPDSGKVLLTIVKPVYVSAGPDSSMCGDQPFTLSKAMASNYSTVTWSTSGDGTFNDPNSVNPVYAPGTGDILQGKTVLILTAEGIVPCLPASDSLLLTINKKPSVHPGSDGVICQGMTFTVTGVTAFEYSYFTWQSNGQGVLSDTTTLSPVYIPGTDETGTVIMTLKVFGTLSCQDSMVSCQVKVNIYSPVVVDAGKDQTIAYDTIARLQATASGGTGDYTYEWEPSSLLQDDTARLTQTVPLKKDTLFIVTVTDKATGCTASDSIRIFTGPGEGLDSCIVVHNVITPNGDGLNDTWIIDCIENYPDNTVQIFNRWGDIVNSFDHYDNTNYVWKGTNKNGKLLPAGTYYYVLQIKNEKTRTGWVLLRCGSK